ncbi:MAG: hypothetical protein JWM68_707 [Verrucomicrobiales bacterium]|nr:hypothetical protein [Verrucomicrobiales bacterium]
MLKIIIGLVIAAALAFGGWQIYLQWNDVKEKPSQVEAQAAPVDAASLPGMPAAMEAAYSEAKAKGPAGLKYFLTRYGKAIKDPRLASIQLDYVVLVTSKDIAEARRVFAEVKARMSPDSPVYSRAKELEKTYE